MRERDENMKEKNSFGFSYPSGLVAIHPFKQSLPLLFICFFQMLEGHCEVSAEPSLQQAKQAQFFQRFSVGEVLWPFDGDSDSPSPPSSFCTWPVTNDSTAFQQAKPRITHLWQFTRLLVGIKPSLATLPWVPRPAPVPLET